MGPRSWTAWHLTKKDIEAISQKLAALADNMSLAGGAQDFIREAVAKERAKLEEECKRSKASARLVAKMEVEAAHGKENVPPAQASRESTGTGGDSEFGDGVDSSNVDYLARADTARQLILSHDVFKGIVDELPLAITGAQAQLSGVQDRRPTNIALYVFISTLQHNNHHLQHCVGVF